MDIDEFLAAQKSRGEVESEGVFTLSVEKARQKLGKFQLDDPSFYLLKMVQAAVWGGATRIDLRTSRSKLALWFDSPVPLGSFEQLLAALRSPLDAPNGPVKLMALAVNASLFSDPPQVSLVWWGDGESQALMASGDEITMVNAPGRPEGVSSSANLYLFAVTKPRKGFFTNATAQEHAAICGHCGFCPVDIRVDGFKLPSERIPRPRVDPWLAEMSDDFPLVERLVSSSDGGIRVGSAPGKRRKPGRSGRLRLNREPETFCLQPLEEAPVVSVLCNEAFSQPLSLRGPDKVTFVCHGVKAATVTVTTQGSGAMAVICGDNLSYDISGFGVIRDARYHEAIRKVQATWDEVAQSVRPDLGSLMGTVTEVEEQGKAEARKQGCGCSVMGCFGFILLAGNLPILQGEFTTLAGFVTMLVSGALPIFRPKPDPHKPLRDAVLQRLDEMRVR